MLNEPQRLKPRSFCLAYGAPEVAPFQSGLLTVAEQFAERLCSGTSGAKALAENAGFTAALKALRHPKSSSSANCEAALFKTFILTAAEAAPFQNLVFFKSCMWSQKPRPVSPKDGETRTGHPFIVLLLIRF
jgi:hypothetical protein